MTVEDRLREARPPEPEAARERARRVVLASAPQPAPRRRRAPLAVLAVLVATLAVALTPPGNAVARWLTDLVTTSATAPPPAQPQLKRLPGAGQVLAGGRDGTFVVFSDGSRERIGTFVATAWSPRGLFVAGAWERQLTAVATDGSVHWKVDAPDNVYDPRWSPSGYRVAYRAGEELWTVAGDGSGARRVAGPIAPVAPAWQPGPAHVVAAVSADGPVEVWSVDDARRVARLPGPGSQRTPLALLWADEATLVIVRRYSVQVARIGPRGVIGSSRREPLKGPVSVATLLDRTLVTGVGEKVYTQTLRARKQRLRLTAVGDVFDLVPAPSADQVLVATGAGRWVFLPARASGTVRAVAEHDLTRVSGWQTEPLASDTLSDGRRITLTASAPNAHPCLIVTGVDEDDRQCGRAPSGRVPATEGNLLAGPTAQRSPDAPLEVYGETSNAVERVRLDYRTAGVGGVQYALVLHADDPDVLERAGIREPFGYYFAELPSDATAVVATALDADGGVLATGDYRDFADLDPHAFINASRANPAAPSVRPRTGGRLTNFRVRITTSEATGVTDGVRRSYSARARRVRPAPGCVVDRSASFRPGPAGAVRTAVLDEARGEGGPEGWCPGRYRVTVSFHEPQAHRVVDRLSFRVRR